MDNIESYPLDKNLYLFKEGLINKNNAVPIKILLKLGLEESKESPSNNIKELTIDDDRKLISAAISLYNDLT